MDAQERRLRNLEKVIPKRTVDFEASFENLDSPIDLNDTRLRRGVEEFVEFLPGTGKHEMMISGHQTRSVFDRYNIVSRRT